MKARGLTRGGVLVGLGLLCLQGELFALVQDGKTVWEFPNIGVPYFGGPYNKDPTIQGTILY